jgi:nitrite reductase/ring-hydroxylating ferredoxin subunit
MTRRIRICEAAEVEPETHLQMRVPELGVVAVYHVGGEFFVTADSCTHMQASLGEEGMLEGHVIQCTWHNGKFDIRTGEVLGPPCPAPLKTYKVTLEGDVVYADVD